MDEKRLKGLLGICVRSGQAVFGEDNCRKAVPKGICGMLLVDSGVSGNTRKRYESLCRTGETKLVFLPEGLLEAATGKEYMAMAVRKGPLLDQVAGCLQQGDTK